jgi:hypothetical protein
MPDNKEITHIFLIQKHSIKLKSGIRILKKTERISINY